jgi:lactoylglutathione lyase
MIDRIHSATVAVADQAAAVDFYVNKLGWQKAMDVPMGENGSFITVVPPGAATHLALSPKSWFSEEGMPNKSTGISFATKDIDATYETLTACGVRFKEPPKMMPWGGRATWLYDLDDNEFFLAEE